MDKDTNPLDKEPAEGSRGTIDKELQRRDRGSGQGSQRKATPPAGDAVDAPREKPVMDSTRGLP